MTIEEHKEALRAFLKGLDALLEKFPSILLSWEQDYEGLESSDDHSLFTPAVRVEWGKLIDRQGNSEKV